MLRLGINTREVLNNHSYMLNAANFLSSYWFDIDGFWHRNGAVILVLVLMLLSKIKDEEADDVQFRVLSENRLGDRFSPHN